mmetsp:Transcript_66474/g.158558  ORF Transcript_66474/g.158558 Transcript_66474/m.158558 type:complete len:226 (-) Transcript_66474:745-1422(-)
MSSAAEESSASRSNCSAASWRWGVVARRNKRVSSGTKSARIGAASAGCAAMAAMSAVHDRRHRGSSGVFASTMHCRRTSRSRAERGPAGTPSSVISESDGPASAAARDSSAAIRITCRRQLRARCSTLSSLESTICKRAADQIWRRPVSPNVAPAPCAEASAARTSSESSLPETSSPAASFPSARSMASLPHSGVPARHATSPERRSWGEMPTVSFGGGVKVIGK